jgi:hypothetical protein
MTTTCPSPAPPARPAAPPPGRTEWLFRAARRVGDVNPLLHLVQRYRAGERAC